MERIGERRGLSRSGNLPIREETLLTGALEPTNQWYAIAKIAGIKLCEAYRRQHGCDFISAMPTNLYGPGDNYHPEHCHVLPALMSRIHRAKLDGDESVTVWGSGKPRREFLHVDDCARALVFLLEAYTGAYYFNIGTGIDTSIGELAQLICKVTGYAGRLEFDTSRPDGAPRRLLNVGRISELGWAPRYTLADGLQQTYDWFLETAAEGTTGTLRGLGSGSSS